jgi:pimeloyl-ACP methyl ester carboxylesterase
MSSPIRLPVIEQGTPDGVPVVLIHGLGDSARSFEPILDRLPASVRALAVTLRGHGDAPRPRGGYDLRRMAADVRAAMEECGIASAVVAGHSMGAVVATRLALDAPERVAGLVLAGGRGTWRGSVLEEELFPGMLAMTDPVDPAWVRAFRESTCAGAVPAAFLDMVVSESLELPARVWRALVAAMREDHRAELPRIAAPALLVRGGADGLATAVDQDELARLLPGARPATYEGAGHAVHWEQPARFAFDLAAFAAQCARSRQAVLV